MKKLISWLRLMRLSNLPTAWSNILMGHALAVGYWDWRVLLLLGISSCLYLGGMILNDVCDLEVDRQERPERVLPRGEIAPGLARAVAGLMFLVAAILAIVCSVQRSETSGSLVMANPTLAVTLILILVIVIYNFGGKDLIVGPLLMGLCRVLNVLLGTSLHNPEPWFLGFDMTHWYVALCVGLFVAGITWFSRQEHTTSSRKYLLVGGGVMLLAVAALFYLPHSEAMRLNDLEHNRLTSDQHKFVYCAMLVMLMFPALRRVLLAIWEPSPAKVQTAVVACLITLIMIDAALCYLFVPGLPLFAIMVALLVIPAAVAGRYLRGT